MKPFDTIHSRIIPLNISNCDTDQIVPGRFLSRPRSAGFNEQLFHDLRYENGCEQPDFPMNWPQMRGAEVLLAGPNFGCGSSRESAVWALVDSGIRVVLAPSFGDIFFGNAFKNGLLPIQLTTVETERLLRLAQLQPEQSIEIDLPKQVLRHSDGTQFAFHIDTMRKQMLIRGMDEITFTLTHATAMARFQHNYDSRHPWLAQKQ